MNFLLNKIYKYYHNTRSDNFSLIHFIHELIFSNKFITEYIFNLKINIKLNAREKNIHKFDLTTYLLKKTLNLYLKNNSIKKILEIGTGSYAILSIYCVKKFGIETHAIDINENKIKTSLLTINYNNVEVRAFKSNLFENINDNDYDLIFWNLPYYEKKEEYLVPLIKQAHNYLSKDGSMMLGYNTSPLKRNDVKNLVDNNKLLLYQKDVSFSWNKHIISIIKRNIS